MRVLVFIWKAILAISTLFGIVGIISIFQDISQWGAVISNIAPYIDTIFSQISSGLLLLFLIIDFTLKKQHILNRINHDISALVKKRIFSKKTNLENNVVAQPQSIKLTTDSLNKVLKYDESGKELKICNDCKVTVHNRHNFLSILVNRFGDTPGKLISLTGGKLLFEPHVNNENKQLVKLMDFYGHDMWVHEYLISNEGDNVIYNLTLPVRVTYQEIVQISKGLRRAGTTIQTNEMNIPIIDRLNPGESYTLWFMNRSKYCLSIHLSDLLVGEMHEGKCGIRYLLHPRSMFRLYDNLISLGPRSNSF